MPRSSIITISRQYGSGGRTIGRLLAEKLGTDFYDKELVTLASEKSGYTEGMFERATERRVTNSLLYSIAMVGNSPAVMYDVPVNEKLFAVQSDVIRKVAQNGGCVIVGRCADYILREDPRCFNVFIYASIEDRIKRAVEEYGVEAKGAKDKVIKTDKQRASYYNFYTDGKWGSTANYDLCVSTSACGVSGAVDVIIAALEAHTGTDLRI